MALPNPTVDKVNRAIMFNSEIEKFVDNVVVLEQWKMDTSLMGSSSWNSSEIESMKKHSVVTSHN